MCSLRVRVYLVQETTTVLLVKHAGKPPRLILKWLDVLDFNHKNVPRLCSLDLKGTSQVVDLCKVDILHIISAIVVADLAAGPVNTFDLYDFAVFNCTGKGNCRGESCQLGSCSGNGPSGCHRFCGVSVIAKASMTNLTANLTCNTSCSAAGFFKSTLATYLSSCRPILNF